MTQEERIRKIGQEVIELLVRKNHDYNDSFSKQYEKYGILSGMIRMDDKMQRLGNLLNSKQQQVSDESLEDTLRDLCGYSMLTLVEMSKKMEFKSEK